MSGDRTPLGVDLDGTLITVDTLRLSVVSLLKRRPYLALGMALALRGGRAGFKAYVARHFIPDPASLPWRAEVVEFVRAQHAAGRPILLVTAAHTRIADAVARHLQLFDAVLATSDHHNLKGRAKLDALYARGEHSFDFVSDSAADLPVLAASKNVFLVAPSPALEQAPEIAGRIAGIFCRS